MGISGLLPLLKSIHNPTHIQNWAGLTVAIDAYGWLHRGAVACAVDLGLSKSTTKYVDFAMSRIRLLQHYGVVPYMVFDGDYLPGKANTEAARQSRRDAAKARGLELLRLGKSSQAYLELQKAIDVTPEMAKVLIEELKACSIQYIVAPYEADAQMAYLERIGVVDAIISEDSDLLVFGAKCLLTKLDQYGACIEINRSKFSAVTEVSLAGWSDADFRCMTILSGCDYLPNIPKLGLKTAYRLVRKYKSSDRMIQALRLDGNYAVPSGYEKAFKEADLTFQYQRVFCPIGRTVAHCGGGFVSANDPNNEYLGSIGAEISDELAAGIAIGELNPITKCAFPEELARIERPQRTEIKPIPKSKTLEHYFASKGPPLQEVSQNTLRPDMKSKLKRPPVPKNASSRREPASKGRTTVSGDNLPRKRLRLCEEEASTESAPQRSRFFPSTSSSKKPFQTSLSKENISTEDIKSSSTLSPETLQRPEYPQPAPREWHKRFAYESNTSSSRGNKAAMVTGRESKRSRLQPLGEKLSGIWKLSYQQKG